MEVGQIINSVNNIYMICQRIAEDKQRKLPSMEKESEQDPDLVANMIYKLETGADYMEDLVSVLKDLNREYRWEDMDKDKYYEESAKMAAMGQGAGGMIAGAAKPVATPAMGKKQMEAGLASSGAGSKVPRNPTTTK